MGNIGETIKRFVGNKNTITILAVLAGVVILWYFYNYRVDQAITTQSIPYAIERIDTTDKIETDNIGYKDITSSTLRDSDIITDISSLTDKYVCQGTSIPANGFFYQSQLCDKSQIKNSIFDDMPKDWTAYTLDVDSKSTYADSILPGDYIDLYIQAVNDENKVIYGPLIESIKVTAVRDSENRDLFCDSEAGPSAYLLFSVPEEYSRLLNVSDLVSNYSIKITPVPRGSAYSQNPGETKIANAEMCYFILRNYESNDIDSSICTNKK